MSEKQSKNSEDRKKRVEETRKFFRKLLGDGREAKLEEWRRKSGQRLIKLINSVKKMVSK